jgi:hypothetical protein
MVRFLVVFAILLGCGPGTYSFLEEDGPWRAVVADPGAGF